MHILYNILQPEKIDTVTELRWLAELTAEKQQSVQCYRLRDDRLRSLAGLQLLKHALQLMGYSQFRLTELISTEYGKPGIPYPADFSISHSGMLCCCVVTRKGAVGIDVERLREVNPQLGKKYLFPDDKLPRDNLTLLRHWTCKEAVLKATGEGLHGNLRAISIIEEDTRLFADYHQQRWCLTPLALAEGYVAHLASAQCPESITMEIVSL